MITYLLSFVVYKMISSRLVVRAASVTELNLEQELAVSGDLAER